MPTSGGRKPPEWVVTLLRNQWSFSAGISGRFRPDCPTIELSKMGAVYEVNKADVICGNIQTANATVYILNSVLTPMH